MKKKYMLYAAAFFFAVLLVCLLSACGEGDNMNKNEGSEKTELNTVLQTGNVGTVVTTDNSFVEVPDEKEYWVLFIGNSHTFFNDLPTIFENIAKADGKEIVVKSVLCGGHTLEQDADSSDTYGKQIYKLLKNETFDFVILQENSDELMSDKYYPDRYEKAVETLNNLIRRNGAQPILYSTWGNRLGNNVIDKNKTVQLAVRSRKIGEKLDIPVAYAGFGFMNIYNIPGNNINLHYTDNHHPSEFGSYLAAMTIYQTMFTNRDVREIDYNGSITSAVAKKLKNAAYEVVKDPSPYFN